VSQVSKPANGPSTQIVQPVLSARQGRRWQPPDARPLLGTGKLDLRKTRELARQFSPATA